MNRTVTLVVDAFIRLLGSTAGGGIILSSALLLTDSILALRRNGRSLCVDLEPIVAKYLGLRVDPLADGIGPLVVAICLGGAIGFCLSLRGILGRR